MQAPVKATIVGIQAPAVISMGRSWTNPALGDEILRVATAGLPATQTEYYQAATAEYDPSLTDEQVTRLKADLEEVGTHFP